MKKQLKNLLFATILVAASTTLHAQQWELGGNNIRGYTKWLGTQNARDLIIKTNNGEAMRIKGTTGTDNHWIGIGMDPVTMPNPLNEFHIHNGAIRLTGGVPRYGGPQIIFGGNYQQSNQYGEWSLEYTTATTPGGLNFWRPTGHTGDGGNYVLFLSNNANIGIGTNTIDYAKLYTVASYNNGILPLNLPRYAGNFENTASTYGTFMGLRGAINNTFAQGGYALNIGVAGDAITAGGGDHRTVGVQGTASGGSFNNGGFFVATGNGNTANYGVYAKASGSNDPFNDWSGYFDGNVQILGNLYNIFNLIFSDTRFKKDIKPLDNVLEKLQKLNGYTYKYKANEYKERHFDDSTHIGFLAQELKDVFPELVRQDDKGFYAVNYDGMIPVLLQAVKEQQKQVNEQKASNENLQQQINELKNIVARLQVQGSEENTIKSELKTADISSNAYLYQIAPNPFSQKATISFKLPAYTSNAQLLITDAAGKTVKTYILSTGSTQQDIYANNLAAGIYHYSLLVNGKMIDSKQMVITK